MLLPFFTWCEQTAIGATIRDSTWLFPVIEAVHLLGLAMLGGAVLLVNLRMMGLTMRQQSIADMTREVYARLIAETYGGALNAVEDRDKVTIRLSFPGE